LKVIRWFIWASQRRFLRALSRPSELYDYWDEAVDIEAICYTPQEFARKMKQHGIVRNAVKEGIEL